MSRLCFICKKRFAEIPLCEECYKEIEERPDGTEGLITEFLEVFERIENKMIFELREGTWNADIKNKTKDAKYWKGYRYGLQAFWGDWDLLEKEKWEEKLK